MAHRNSASALDAAIRKWRRNPNRARPSIYGQTPSITADSRSVGYGRVDDPTLPEYIEGDTPSDKIFRRMSLGAGGTVGPGARANPDWQRRGQAPYLDSPMVREIILGHADSEASIAKLIDVFGIATVERVLMEDIGGMWNEQQDTRPFSDDSANLAAIENLRARRGGGWPPTPPPKRLRRYSDWMR